MKGKLSKLGGGQNKESSKERKKDGQDQGKSIYNEHTLMKMNTTSSKDSSQKQVTVSAANVFSLY